MEEPAPRRRPRRPPRLIPSTLEGPGIRTYIIASVSVLLACSAIAVWIWNGARLSEKRNLQEGLGYSTILVQEALQNRLRTYEELTRGSAALFNAQRGQVTRQAWHDYAQSFELSKNYPGVRSLGYAPYVSRQDYPAFQAQLAQEGVTNFSLTPAGDRDQYLPITYLETNTPRESSLGVDLLSETNRRAAVELARDNNMLAISSRVTPIKHPDDQSQVGFYIFYPVYRPGAPVGTVAQRQAAVQGYVFSTLFASELFKGLFQSFPVASNDYALQFFDGPKASPDKVLYQTDTFAKLAKAEGTVTVARPVMLDNRQWTIAVYLSKNLVRNDQRLKPFSILVYGLAFSFMLSGLLLIIMINRARSITYEKQVEVQAAKDELLSLASHQLRTPATGVKQFVGMLLQGYAGKLTKEQRSMLEKAYRSNERQLEIINDILHVTRLDSGRIVLNLERIELNTAIRDIIDEQRSTFTERQQKVSFRSSAKKVFITADAQYLAMALDNLISNASKYSQPGKRISIRVVQHRDEVSIAVIDHGVGIDEEDLGKLFKKFSRIHNDLSVEAGGSGIGLYLCQEIIRLHNGTIDVETAPSRGSTFTVKLPKRQIS